MTAKYYHGSHILLTKSCGKWGDTTHHTSSIIRKGTVALLITVILCSLVMASGEVLAKPKAKSVPPGQAKKVKLSETQSKMASVYGVKDNILIWLEDQGLDDDEVSFLLFMYGNSGAKMSKADVAWLIKSEDNWVKLAWYLGQPPVTFPKGPIRFRRPVHPRVVPPMGRKTYHYEKNGPVREKLEIGPHKYEYRYENKRAKVEERVEIDRHKYEYRYKDRYSEERLEVDLDSYRYEYFYRNRRTGEVIRDSGIAAPLHRKRAGRLAVEAIKKPAPSFQLKVNLNFDIDL